MARCMGINNGNKLLMTRNYWVTKWLTTIRYWSGSRALNDLASPLASDVVGPSIRLDFSTVLLHGTLHYFTTDVETELTMYVCSFCLSPHAERAAGATTMTVFCTATLTMTKCRSRP